MEISMMSLLIAFSALSTSLYRPDEGLGVLDGRVEEDAMAEVGDVARPAAPGGQHTARLLDDALARPEQEARVEVALDRETAARAAAGLGEVRAPVDAQGVGARGGRQLDEVRALADVEHARGAAGGQLLE